MKLHHMALVLQLSVLAPKYLGGCSLQLFVSNPHALPLLLQKLLCSTLKDQNFHRSVCQHFVSYSKTLFEVWVHSGAFEHQMILIICLEVARLCSSFGVSFVHNIDCRSMMEKVVLSASCRQKGRVLWQTSFLFIVARYIQLERELRFFTGVEHNSMRKQWFSTSLYG